MKKLKLSLVLLLALAAILALSACTMPMMQTCTVHRDLNQDTYCDVCQAYVPVNCPGHLDENHDGMCDTKGCTMMLTPMHYDNDCNGKCDVEECGKVMKVKHEDDDANGFCDKCNLDLTLNCEHEDGDEDYFCDLCNKQLEICNHVDEDGDQLCDECGREVEITVCDHKDADFNGKCDVCKNEIPGTLPLVSTGIMNFQFVLFNGAPTSYVQIVDSFIGDLQKNAKIDVKERVFDTASTITDYEILIGNCTSRGEEYQFDEHVYGPKGYAIKIIGTKIVVLYGSEGSFDDALAALKSEIIGVTEEGNRVRNRYISAKNSIEVVQDDYRVTTLTLNGQDMKGFTIAVDKTNATTLAAAEELRDTLYNDTGYWFEIVSLDEADKSIVIRLEEKDPDPAQRYNNPGFKVSCLDNRIEFVAEYATAYMPLVKKDSVTGTDVIERYSLTVDYFSGKLYKAENMTLNLVSEVDDDEKDIRFVYYKDFGVKSFDQKDDSEAIRAAHEYANLGGHKVIAEAGAFYDIFAMETTITVKTDVDWKDATFYLHDNTINPSQSARGTQIFTIARDEGSVRVPKLADKIAELNANGGIDASSFTSFNIDFGRPMLLSVSNGNHINYIRYGVNASEGGGQREVILVDKDGNLDDSTPLMFDFEYITGITCYPIDDLPLTIEGGVFRTSPFFTDTPQGYTSYGRGIQCGRSNTTFKNVRHLLENEGNYDYDAHSVSNPRTEDYGCPYGGFYSTSLCNNITYVGCQMSAHITYKGSNGAGMGTYDVSPGNSINVVYEECYQDEINFFNKTYVKDANGNPTTNAQQRWGVMGSSGNKNVTFLNSRLTRMDAHGGIHNVYIIGSELTMIRVDGTGIFYMENSIVHGSSTYVGLREDYGGFWHGNVILKDCKTTVGTTHLFTNTWYNHYFGYPTAYPTNILIDNFQAGKLSGGSFYFNDGATFTPLENATVNVFGSETSTSDYDGDGQKDDTVLGGIHHAAHSIMKDYLPATTNNSVYYNPDGSLFTTQKYYANGAPVVVPNKNQTPAPERLIIKNCDESIKFVIPDKEKYPWFANMVVSVNQTTECEQHFDCFGDGDKLCDDCGAEITECTEHFDGNNDGSCAICFIDVPIKCDSHIDKDLNGKCDTCNALYICSGHVDWNEDTICDKCGGVLGCPGEEHTDLGKHADVLGAHKDENTDGKCDLCSKDMTDTADCAKNSEANGKCDKCREIMTEDATCTANGDGYCDVCTKLIPKCESCVDEINENKLKIRDGKCDKCKADIVALITPCDECVDEDGDDVCDRCVKKLPCKHEDNLGAHVDEAEDGICDKCEGAMSEELTCAGNADGVCDKCKEPMPKEPCDECVDTDPKDELCDVCGGQMPAILPCEHEDSEDPIGKCDKCEKDIPTEE